MPFPSRLYPTVAKLARCWQTALKLVMVRLQLEHLGMKIPDDQPVDLAKTLCPLNNSLHSSCLGTGTCGPEHEGYKMDQDG